MSFGSVLAFLRFMISESHHCIITFSPCHRGPKFWKTISRIWFSFFLFKLQQYNLGDNLEALKTLSLFLPPPLYPYICRSMSVEVAGQP